MHDSATQQRLMALAAQSTLLVACDFDGTIADITSRPSDAAPRAEATEALRALASMPNTHVVVLSGRGVHDLRDRLGPIDGVRLVGSHGGEDPAEGPLLLGDAQRAALAAVRAAIETIVPEGRGFLIEPKPTGLAVHYRLADPEAAGDALALIASGPALLPGVTTKHGKMVIELSVVDANKGQSLRDLIKAYGAGGTLFLGDDLTDEDAFAALSPRDVGVKIGDGPSRADCRVATPHDASLLLGMFALMRRDACDRLAPVPIEQHAMLSDQRTVALLTPSARVVWCCLPRIDSPALFAELLGGPSAGYFAIQPVEGGVATQRYLGDSFAVETAWRSVTVTDCLDCSGGRAFMRAGRTDLLRVVRGSGEVRIVFAPRLDFGRHATRLRVVPEGIVVEGTLDPVVLRSPGVTWRLIREGQHQLAEAIVAFGEAPLVLELRYGLSTTKELVAPTHARIEQTCRFWELWAAPLKLPRLHRDLVRRSALVIKALCYGPSGAISAAGTTSLPETIGGVRNWDYRFCWLRDAALAATSLAHLGSSGIGTKFLDWMLGVLDHEGGPERFRPVYTVNGSHLGAEAELGELVGYRGSRPVRVGNAAGQQLQLDVFGPILDLLAVLAEGGLPLSAEHWRLTEAIVRAVGLRWTEPDHGIWEVRGPLRHHVHSKVMCWVAVDRSIAVAQAFASDPPGEWLALRDEIARDVLKHGWSRKVGSFTAAYGETTIDAATLQIGLSGLLSPQDPRYVATVERIERELRVGPTVHRYLFDDGLPGAEGGFQLCTAWMIEALAASGSLDRARALLDDYASRFGPTGLAAEEYLPATGEWLGNHPQAYSHLGLINAVLACERAERGNSA